MPEDMTNLDDVIDSVVEMTGDASFLDEMIAAETDTRSLLDRVDLTDDLDAVESQQRRRESRFRGSIRQTVARLESSFEIHKAENAKRSHDREAEYIKRAMEFELTLRAVRRDIIDSGGTVPTSTEETAKASRQEIEKTAKLVRQVYDKWFTSVADSYRSSINTLTRLEQRYRSRSFRRRLRRYAGWIFWSLFVCTIAAGAIGELFPVWYLSVFLFPTIGWLIALIVDPILECRDRNARRSYLRTEVQDLGSEMFWLPLRIAMAEHSLKRSAEQSDAREAGLRADSNG